MGRNCVTRGENEIVRVKLKFSQWPKQGIEVFEMILIRTLFSLPASRAQPFRIVG